MRSSNSMTQLARTATMTDASARAALVVLGVGALVDGLRSYFDPSFRRKQAHEQRARRRASLFRRAEREIHRACGGGVLTGDRCARALERVYDALNENREVVIAVFRSCDGRVH